MGRSHIQRRGVVGVVECRRLLLEQRVRAPAIGGGCGVALILRNLLRRPGFWDVRGDAWGSIQYEIGSGETRFL